MKRSPSSFEEAIDAVVKEIRDTVVRKQHDYGPYNILHSPFGPERALLVRIWDKFARIKNLIERGNAPVNEGLDDSWLDMAGYAIIALMVRKGYFELPMSDEV
jgi:hypothetical protein